MLASVNGRWTKNMKYKDIVDLIRAAPRPVTMGFIGTVPLEVLVKTSTSIAAQASAKPRPRKLNTG